MKPRALVMPRILNDFRCHSCGAVAEHFVDNRETTVVCHDCRGTASKVQAAIRCNLDPVSGDFPGATDSWVRKRERQMKLEQKHSSFDG